MRQSLVSLDASFHKLRALAGLAGGSGGGGGAGAGLSRYKFVDGGTVETTQNGAIGTPFKTISEAMVPLATSASVADASAFTGVKVTPALGGYVETVNVPGYRCIEIRGDQMSYGPLGTGLTGNIVWNNVAGVGRNVPTPEALLIIHNPSMTGNITVTDDAVAGTLLLSNDEGSLVTGNIDTHTTTHLVQVGIEGVTVNGSVTLGTTANSAILSAYGAGADITGAVTAKAVVFGSGMFFAGPTITVGAGGQSSFNGTQFSLGTNPVLAGGAGSFAVFDGASWRSFLEAGGTVTPGGILVTVVGGYDAGAVEGAALTNVAAISLSLNGVGATAGFTGGGNHYSYPTTALGQTLTITLLAAGAFKGDTLNITRKNFADAHTIVVNDFGGATLATLPVSSRGFVKARFDGTNWQFDQGGAGILS